MEISVLTNVMVRHFFNYFNLLLLHMKLRAILDKELKINWTKKFSLFQDMVGSANFGDRQYFVSSRFE